MAPYIRVIIYFLTFGASLYSLNAINFSKIIYPKRVVQAQVLIILLAMALAYLVTQFLIGLSLSV